MRYLPIRLWSEGLCQRARLAIRKCKLPVLQALENPIWHSLATRHAHLARSHGVARRYPAEVAPFVGVPDASEKSAQDIGALVQPGDRIGILGVIPALQEGWSLVYEIELRQYIWGKSKGQARTDPKAIALGEEHLDRMLELTALVYPAYFRPGTARLGHYVGLFEGDRLAAMAGIRMAMEGFQELSAICTHPDFRGRGFASRLTEHLVAHVEAQGEVAFLHTESDNEAAQRVYEKLGFALRAKPRFQVLDRG